MRRTLTGLLCAGILAMTGPALAETDLTEMSPAERDAFRNEVRDYLMENPEVIFEAIQILEQRREVAAQQADRDIVQANIDALLNDGFSYVGGNPDGDVTIVEFLDYRCGFCKRAHPVIQEVVDRDPNVRLVTKDFPILGPDSVRAGRIALAAVEIDPERFLDLNDEMMTYQGNLTEQVAYRLAGEVGYDVGKLREIAGSDLIEERLQQNYQLAQRLGLQGTPAFVVGNEIIRGFLEVDDMIAAVQDARGAQN
ncbi:MAG: DsbA family protein [Pseudomonadota bacterium]